MIGSMVSHYRILSHLGSGGMGTVYLADDTTLNRKVALKFLTEAGTRDPHGNARLLREARAASALDHPNIATVYEVGEWEGLRFIAMAYYIGETLRDRMERGSLTIGEVIGIGVQVASAVSAAHAAGIMHRDLKPANIMLTADGPVKLLDFGLAKALSTDADTESRLTDAGTTPGTVAYMAPEQIRGLTVDARADVWAFGVVLYEMLSGRRLWHRDTVFATMEAILTTAPHELTTLRPDTPPELSALVNSALTKDSAARAVTMSDAARALAACQARVSVSASARANRQRRRTVVLAVALLFALLGATIGWRLYRESRVKWARETALPEIAKLIEAQRLVAAFDLASQAALDIPSDPVLVKAWRDISQTLDVDSTPPGAQVSYREYGVKAAPWRVLGPAPLTNTRLPRAVLEWKAELAGFVTAEDVGVLWSNVRFTLQRPESLPPGMVRASTGATPFTLQIPGLDHVEVRLGDFFIDRREVTNRDFKRFVDARGYTRSEFWRQPFVTDHGSLSRERAMRVFVDTTGRPGPARWELGQYPAGEDDLPVTGVSWYEAAAYAEFVGKALPTIFHWSAAADPELAPSLVPASNFAGRGLRAVGTSGASSRFGTLDMAGNAKEWVWNAAASGTRYILGGSWNEPMYMFTNAEARSPFAREATFGFRCMKAIDSIAVPPAATQSIEPARDLNAERPVSDDVFRAYRSIYSYDRAALKAHVDSADDSSADWRLEHVSFAAAYGDERVDAYLFLPKHASPPYQVVVEFPGGHALGHHRFDPNLDHDAFRFVVQSGRALMIPLYKGTYERRSALVDDTPNSTTVYRDHVVMWFKDLARSVDYLETRPDVQHDRVGFVGISWGAVMGPIMLALEPRLKAAVLVGGGFTLQRSLPEADVFNFAPRVVTPVLMLNGRFDFLLPPSRSQEPLFRLLGSAGALKRHIVFESGHFPAHADIARETLNWLDQYLGPAR